MALMSFITLALDLLVMFALHQVLKSQQTAGASVCEGSGGGGGGALSSAGLASLLCSIAGARTGIGGASQAPAARSASVSMLMFLHNVFRQSQAFSGELPK